jgi:peptidoglycan biosynthesis protein MviN/MurJ (putative lipid II flippase)
MGYLGLVVATTLSYTVNFVLLFILLSRRYGRLWDGKLLLSLAKMTLSALLMGALAWESYQALQGAFGAASYLKHAIALGGALAVAAAAYAGGCAALKVPEFSQTLRILRR